MGLNTKDINSIEDMQNFVEGCINDYDDNFCTKEELLSDLRDYTLRVIEWAIEIKNK